MKKYTLFLGLLFDIGLVYAIPPNAPTEIVFRIDNDWEKQQFLQNLEKNSNAIVEKLILQETYFSKSNTDNENRSPQNRFSIVKVQLETEDNTVIAPPRTSLIIKSQQEALETTVENTDTIIKMLGILGHEKSAFARKKRTEFTGETMKITYDTIENMGQFFTIQLIQTTSSIEKGRETIYNFLKKAGIKKIIEFDKDFFHLSSGSNPLGIPKELN